MCKSVWQTPQARTERRMSFGPGSGAQGHAANESVPIAEMVEAAENQLAVIERLLG